MSIHAPPFVKRIVFDVTYTNAISTNSGISRVVGSLQREFDMLAKKNQIEFIPVVYGWGGWRIIGESVTGGNMNSAPSVYGFLSNKWIKKIIHQFIGYFPIAITAPLLSKIGKLIFGNLSKNLPRLEISQNDLLFMPDASWNYPVHELMKISNDAGAHTVLIVYDAMPLVRPDLSPQILVAQFHYWFERVIKNTKVILTISDAARDDIVEKINRIGNPQQDTGAVGKFRLGGDAVRNEKPLCIRDSLHELKKRTPFVASIGAFEKKRNYAETFAALKLLWNKGINISLLLVGRTTDECADLLDELYSDSEFGERLIILHDATDAEVNYIYENCISLIVGSEYEGYGLPLIEARMNGCQVIASDIKVFREIADDQVIFFKVGSENELASSIENILAMSHSIEKKKMPTFSWADSCQDCWRQINRMIK